MKTVKIVEAILWSGDVLPAGQVVKVEDEVAAGWIDRKLAVSTPEATSKTLGVVTPPSPPPAGVSPPSPHLTPSVKSNPATGKVEGPLPE